MNEIADKYVLVWDKFMYEMNLRQPALLYKLAFTYSACGSFRKNK